MASLTMRHECRLGVFENWMSKKRREITAKWRRLAKHYQGDQIKKNWMGGI